MSVSNHSSTHKKSASKSRTAQSTSETEIASVTATPSSAEPAAPVHAPPLDPAPTPSLATLASESVAQLDALEAKLNLNIVVNPNDKNQMRALARVSDTAIGLASDIVRAAPARFPDFASLVEASDYVSAVGPLADRAVEFGTHLQKSVENQRAPAAQQTLALYAVAKGLGRITGNETMREKVRALKVEIAPKRKNPKPKVTKDEKAARSVAASRANRVTKAMKIIAEYGASGTVPAPAAVAPAITPAMASAGLSATSSAPSVTSPVSATDSAPLAVSYASPPSPPAPQAQSPSSAPVAAPTPTSVAPDAPPTPAAH